MQLLSSARRAVEAAQVDDPLARKGDGLWPPPVAVMLQVEVHDAPLRRGQLGQLDGEKEEGQLGGKGGRALVSTVEWWGMPPPACSLTAMASDSLIPVSERGPQFATANAAPATAGASDARTLAAWSRCSAEERRATAQRPTRGLATNMSGGIVAMMRAPPETRDAMRDTRGEKWGCEGEGVCGGGGGRWWWGGGDK